MKKIFKKDNTEDKLQREEEANAVRVQARLQQILIEEGYELILQWSNPVISGGNLVVPAPSIAIVRRKKEE